MEHLLPAGQLYIYKSLCAVQIAAIHTKKIFDALIELRFIVVEEEREIHQVLFLKGRQNIIVQITHHGWFRFQLEDALCNIGADVRIG